MSDRQALARSTAHALFQEFVQYHDGFRAASRRSARHYAARDWHATRREAAARLALYRHHVNSALADTRARLRGRVEDIALWSAMRDCFAGMAQSRDDRVIAETFFNSVTRRLLGTVGVDRDVEFVRAFDAESAQATQGTRGAGAGARWCSGEHGLERLGAAILGCVPHALEDITADARRVGAEIAAAARAAWGSEGVDGAEVLPHPFYRNKGAYLVGRLRSGDRMLPLVIALLHDRLGIFVDAVLTSPDEVSIVFGFSWSYFHVDVARPCETVAFLHSIMPLKRVDELYTSIGYNKHGKTELYRALLHHLELPDARFEEAEGTKGLVMSVFTLPSLNIVFKVIRDAIGHPKRITRREVMEKYHFVFLRDRVGRLADAQEFEHLEFRASCFSAELLEELLRAAPSIVRVEGDRVVVGHLYTERRLRPLNLYVRESDPAAAEAAIVDYGNAIRDLATADIFTGDMLLKNFGVSRHGRVIFYDYDELAALTECRFRSIPEAMHTTDELSAEPWFSVGEHDVFPEEFAPFLVPDGPLREVFLAAHAELLEPEWWRSIQERLREGELFDFYPYPRERRLRVAEGRPVGG